MSCDLVPWLKDSPIADAIYREYALISGIRRFTNNQSLRTTLATKTLELTIADNLGENTGSIQPEPSVTPFNADIY